MDDPLLLPPGSRLVHIGPHKTGTTALQWALHHARESLHEQGAHYAHRKPQAYKPAIALTGLKGRIGGPQVDDKPWRRLVAEVERQQDRRVVISSESFSNSRRAHIERLADDLGRDRVHIVRMLRRYDKMLPSQWQQSIAAGGRQPFEAFLEKVRTDPTHGFWRRHGFAELTREWADVVGPERVTTVVVDEGDRGWLLRVMERMVGLREHTLLSPPDRTNRSLTRAEVELLRRFNQIRHQQGWVDRVHFNYVRLSASPAMRRLPPDPEGGRIDLPADLRPMLAEATERDLEALADLGVRIVGDTELLRPPASDDAGWGQGNDQLPTVAVDSAVASVTAVVARVEEHGPIPLRRRGDDRSVPPTAPAAQPTGGGPVVRLPRRAKPHVVAPPTSEGDRLRRVLSQLSDLSTGAKHPRIVDRLEDVSGARAHVVLLAVPPHQLLASQWHEHVVARGGMTYEAWLTSHRPSSGSLPEQVRQAVERWGAQRVNVLVADAFHPWRTDAILASVSGVDPDALSATTEPRSLMSWSETALMRRLDEYADEHGWDESAWNRYVGDGVLPWLLSAPPARLDLHQPLDEGAAEWVRRETQALLDAVSETGAQLIGDQAALRRGNQVRPRASHEPRMRPGTAALGLSGVIAATSTDG